MALVGKITVNGDIKNTISSINWGIVQNAAKGKSQGDPHHTTISFVLKNADNAVFYYGWATHKNQAHNAEIIFDREGEERGVLSTLSIKRAMCTGFDFSLVSESSEEILLVITLSAESIDFVDGMAKSN